MSRLLYKISPGPSFSKRGELFLSATSPFEKGGSRGICFQDSTLGNDIKPMAAAAIWD
jgi:hypothetical protein